LKENCQKRKPKKKLQFIAATLRGKFSFEKTKKTIVG